jgi:hypothetical protein
MRFVLILALAACGGSKQPDIVGNTGGPGGANAPGVTSLVAAIPQDDGCALVRLEGNDPPIVIATVKDPCFGARIAKSADGSQFLLWFDPQLVDSGRFFAQGYPPSLRPEEEQGGTGAMYEITAATGKARALPPFPAPDPLEFLGIVNGSIYGFTTHSMLDAKGVVDYLGTKLDFTQVSEGEPAAAVAYQEVNGTWQLSKVTETTTGWDYAAGYSAIELAGKAAPESETLLAGRTEPIEIAETAVVKGLEPMSPIPPKPDEYDRWYTAIPGPYPVYAWMVTGEFTYATGLLVWRDERGQFLPLPKLDASASDIVAITPFGEDYILVTNSNTGTHPRVYNIVGRHLVYSSDQARATMPWF